MLLSPATAPPPSALKNVIALVIAASIRALLQSNLCSFVWVILFVQLSMNPLIVKVVGLLFFRQFKCFSLFLSVSFVKDFATLERYGFATYLQDEIFLKLENF